MLSVLRRGAQPLFRNGSLSALRYVGESQFFIYLSDILT